MINDLEIMTNVNIWFKTFYYLYALVTFIVCVAQRHRCMLLPLLLFLYLFSISYSVYPNKFTPVNWFGVAYNFPWIEKKKKIFWWQLFRAVLPERKTFLPHHLSLYLLHNIWLSDVVILKNCCSSMILACTQSLHFSKGRQKSKWAGRALNWTDRVEFVK